VAAAGPSAFVARTVLAVDHPFYGLLPRFFSDDQNVLIRGVI
jgi:hypothetical protein